MVWTFKNSEIINVGALDDQLEELVSGLPGGQVSDEKRALLLTLFRSTLEAGRRRLHESHLAGATGNFIVSGHSNLMDTVLRRILGIINSNQPIGPGSATFSLVATGGYGRGELAPFSDVDLLFLLPDNNHAALLTQVEKMLYYLWDLGLEVGHAVRTIPECMQHARQEVEIRTSMLESRFLAGSPNLFHLYRETLFAKVLDKDPEAFLRAKLLEQSKRYERFGNSLFYLEPNVKENPGGLRDIQTFFWISKYRYKVARIRDLIPQGIITQEEYRTLTRCREFIRRVRNALHYRAGRRDDRLTFQYQLEISKEFDYRDRPGMRGVEQFMRRYYQVARQVGSLSWVFLRKYQEEHRKLHWWNKRRLEEGFQLLGDKVAITEPEMIRDHPIRLMKLFEVAQRHRKPIHPETMRLVTRSLGLINRDFQRHPEVAAIFLKMLNGDRAVAWVLRRMNTLGLLGRYIPEFGRIIGQTQHDMFHVYTVDEHTILAVEALRHIKSGKFSEELPLSTELMRQMKKPVVLYLAVLFHDIAKGRSGDHSVKGAVIARQVCVRLGLSAEDVEQVSWLVAKHLIFSRTAFRRDINDPETIAQFASQIGTVERLDLLLLLTVADIRAVGPGVWNQWKATLLRRLHRRSLEILKKGELSSEEMARLAKIRKDAVLAALAGEADSQQVRRFLDRFYPDYFTQYEVSVLLEHYRVLIHILDKPLAVLFRPAPAADVTEMLIHAQDHPGLMAKISGVLSAEGANILSAFITTARDGMALDIFTLQSGQGKAIQNSNHLQRIEKTLIQVLAGEVQPETLLARSRSQVFKKRPFSIPVKVDTYDNLDTFTIVEVTALDQLGLLFTITRTLMQENIQIRFAKITTYGERAVDVFYIRDLYGLKLEKKRMVILIRKLTTAIENLEREENAP